MDRFLRQTSCGHIGAMHGRLVWWTTCNGRMIHQWTKRRQSMQPRSRLWCHVGTKRSSFEFHNPAWRTWRRPKWQSLNWPPKAHIEYNEWPEIEVVLGVSAVHEDGRQNALSDQVAPDESRLFDHHESCPSTQRCNNECLDEAADPCLQNVNTGCAKSTRKNVPKQRKMSEFWIRVFHDFPFWFELWIESLNSIGGRNVFRKSNSIFWKARIVLHQMLHGKSL